jgi:hypothetical protein
MKVALLARAALAVAASCFVVLGASPAHAAAIPGAADQVLGLVNQERARAGLSPLTMDAQLNSAAQNYAEAMGSTGVYAHNGADGSTPLSRMNAAGFPGTGAWGENIAAAYNTAAEVMQAWMNSPGHRSNLLNPTFTHIGIGAAQVTGSQWKNYWVQDFSVRSGGSGAGGPVGGPVPQPAPQPQVPAPSLTQAQPSQGAVGTTVTLTGRNFGQTPGTVSFSGLAGQIVSWSDTSIQTQVPSGASSGAVYVQNSRGTSNGVQFTVVSNTPAPAPQPAAAQASYVYPAGGNPGTRVTIYGRGFGSSAGQVMFNGVAGQIVFWYDTLIGVNVPSGATSGALKVRSAGGGESNALQFTVNAGDPAATQPQLVYCSPAAGAVGTQVSVIGRNLGSTPGAVSFNGVAASVVNWTSSAVVVIVPQGATTGQVKVQTGGGTSNGVGFTVVSSTPQPAPQPSPQPAGTRWFGSNAGRSRYVWTQNPAPAPAPAPAPTPPSNTPPSGNTGSAAGGPNTPMPAGPPTVSQISPAVASPGSTITVQGSGFGSSQGWLKVGRVAARVVSWSNTQIVAQVPVGTGTSGQIVVRVIRPDYQASWPVYLGLKP